MLFKLLAKVNIVHVPYKGAGPGLAALTGGEVQVGMFSLVPSMSHVRAGRLKAIGITSAKRSPILPEVAPIADAVGFASTRLNRLQFLTIRRYLSLVFATLVTLMLVLAIWS